MRERRTQSISDMNLDVKQAADEEGTSFMFFSERVTMIIVGSLGVFALSLIMAFQSPMIVAIPVVMIGAASAYLGISIAYWRGFKLPNHPEDIMEDYSSAGFGGTRFSLGFYRHPKPDFGRKAHELLSEAQ
jgi:hypothetical protein